jgi:hypothetical protein
MTTQRKPNRRPDAELREIASGELCAVSGKRRYLSRLVAAAAGGQLQGRDPERRPLDVYRCRSCRDYHVGHDSPRPQRR